MAFDLLKYLITADASEFKQELREANDSFERFRQENRYAIRDVKAWGAAAVAGAAAGAVAIGNMVDTTADEAVQMERLARVTGLTVEEMGRLAYAAAAMGESDYNMSDAADDVADAIATITDRAEDAKAGVQSMVDDFALVGVEVQDLRAKNPRELLNTFADAIANAENKNKALTAGVRILGDDLGRRLLPMLMEGSDGIERLGDKGVRLGRVMNKDLVESAENWNRAMREVNDIMVGTRNEMADELLPAIGDLLDMGAEITRWGGFVGNILITLGGVLGELGNIFMAVGNQVAALGSALGALALGATGQIDYAKQAFDDMVEFQQAAIEGMMSIGDTTASASEAGDKFQSVAFGIADELQSVAAQARSANDELKDLDKTLGRDSTLIGADGRPVTLTGGLSPATLELLEQAEREQEQKEKDRKKKSKKDAREAQRKAEEEQRKFMEGFVGGFDDIERNGFGEKMAEQVERLQKSLQDIGGGQFSKNLEKLRFQFAEGAISAQEYIRGVERVEEAARFFAGLEARAESLRDSLKTPWEEAREAIADYKRMLDEGLISQSQYDQAAAQARESTLPEHWKQFQEEQKQAAAEWRATWESTGDELVSTLSTSIGDIFLDSLMDKTESVQDSLKSLGKQLLMLAARAAILKGLQSAGYGADSNLVSALGFASGGYVSGPGTATSDSIPARLSDGEFVVRAAAVDKYGVGFMDAVNRMQLPAGPQRFAEGGLVRREGGGLNLTIANITDKREIEEVLASSAGERIILNAVRRNSKSYHKVTNKP